MTTHHDYYGEPFNIEPRNTPTGGARIILIGDHSVDLDLPTLRRVIDDLTHIHNEQTEAGTIPGCDGSYTCPARSHSPYCLLTPGN